MKTIALVDPCWGGHHLTYLKFFSEALLKLGHQVIVFCPEPENLKSRLVACHRIQPGAWQAVVYQLPSEPLIARSPLTTRAVALERLSNLAQILSEAEQALNSPIDLVFFCFFDTFIYQFQTALDFDCRLRRRFSGLYFHPWHLRVNPRYYWFRRGPLNPDAVLHSRYCRSVAVLDEGVGPKLSKRLGGKSIVCFPDLTDEGCSDSPTAIENEIRNRAKGRRVVGLLGSLDRRKGLLDFMRHVTVIKNDPICFLIAGKVIEHSFSEEENRVISNFMANSPENAFTYRGFIEDGIRFNSLVRSCDLLYAVYHGFPHSSNMLTKAACMNVPVVVSDQYLMAERVKRFNLGFTIRENFPEDFRSLITSGKAFVLQSEERFGRGCIDYMKENSFDRLAISFQQLLES